MNSSRLTPVRWRVISIGLIFFTIGVFSGLTVSSCRHPHTETVADTAQVSSKSNSNDNKKISIKEGEIQSSVGGVENVVSGENTAKISLDLAKKLWMPPIFDYGKGEFSFTSFLIYGLKSDEIKKLQSKINKAITQLSDIELLNSDLITEPTGEQYFLIKPFPEQGEKLRQELTGYIEDTFRHFDDDRGKLLSQAIIREPVFNNFGKGTTELAIQEYQQDGKQQFALSLRTSNKSLTDTVKFPLSGNYIAKRFNRLVEKHIPDR